MSARTKSRMGVTFGVISLAALTNWGLDGNSNVWLILNVVGLVMSIVLRDNFHNLSEGWFWIGLLTQWTTVGFLLSLLLAKKNVGNGNTRTD